MSVVDTLRIILEADVDGATSELENSGNRVVKTLAAITAAGVVVGGALEGFARSQAETNTILARTSVQTGLQADALRDMAVDASNTTTSVEMNVEALEAMARAGEKNQASLRRLLPDMTTLAKVAGLDVTEAVQLAAKATGTFGEPLEATSQHLDTLSFLLGATSIKADDFGDILGENAIDIKNLGLNLDDVVAVMIAFDAAGVDGENAGEKFGQAIGAAEGNAAKFYESLGLTNEQLTAARERLSGAAGMTDKLAAAQASASTPLEKLLQGAKNLAAEYGYLAPIAGTIAPALMAIGPASTLVAGAFTGILATVKMIVSGIQTLRIAWVVYGGVSGIVAAVNGTLAATFTALWAAIKAHPFVAIISIITLVVAGIIWLYNNCETFRNIVQAVFRAVGAAFSWLYENVFKPVGEFLGAVLSKVIAWVKRTWESTSEARGKIGDAFEAIGKAVMWLWQNVISPFIDFYIAYIKVWWNVSIAVIGAVVTAIGWLVDAVMWLWNNAIAPAFNFMMAIFKAVGETFAWLWNTILYPYIQLWIEIFKVLWEIVLLVADIIVWAFKLIGELAVWLWENAIKPAFDFIIAIFQAVGAAAVWLWENAIKPSFDFIMEIFAAVGAAAMWLYENAIKPAFNFIIAVNNAVGSAIQWLWNNVVSPVFNWIGDKAQWLWNSVFSPVFNWIGEKVSWFGSTFRGVYDEHIAPVVQWIGDRIEDVKRFFSNISFSDIAEPFLRPLREIKSFIESVISAIGRLIDKARSIASSVGGAISTVRSWIPGFANGGRVDTNGPILVGERGPEIMSGMKGRQITPNDRLASGGPTGIKVTFDFTGADRDLRRVFSRSVRTKTGGNVNANFGA